MWDPKQRRFVEETNPYHSLGDVTLFSGCMDDGTSCDVQAAKGAGGALTMYGFFNLFGVNFTCHLPVLIVCN
jgi:hypothetical protein